MMTLEQLALVKLAEECSEVAKIALKAAQFGLDSEDPSTGLPNRTLLDGELQDVLGAVDALAVMGDFRFNPDPAKRYAKVQKILKYAQVCVELGKARY